MLKPITVDITSLAMHLSLIYEPILTIGETRTALVALTNMTNMAENSENIKKWFGRTAAFKRASAQGNG